MATNDALAPLDVDADAITPRDKRRNLLLGVALFVLAMMTFLPATKNQFISYDDPVFVTEQPMVKKGLTADGVIWAFTGFRFYNYHPLAWVTHMADVQFFGLNPAGHHFTSVLLHALTTTLLFALLVRMTAEAWPSAFVAALFAVHPTHVESVAWIAERKDVLCAFFGMCTLLAYASYARKPSALRYLLVLATFTLGLLSKQMIVTLPCVMLLLDFWPLRRMTDRRSAMRLIVEKVPLFVLSAAASVVISFAQASGDPLKSLDDFPLSSRLLNAFNSYLNYLRMTFVPVDLAVFYPYPSGFSPVWISLAIVILLGVTVAVVLVARRKPYLAVGWFWFVGMLVPVIGLVQVGRQAMADRYTYLPHIGLFIAMVWLLKDWTAGRRNMAKSVASLGLVVIVAMAVASWRQIGRWKDSMTLFTHALAVTENNFIAHNQIGNELARAGRIDDAEAHYKAAINAYPEYAMAHVNLARVCLRQKRDDEAYSLLVTASRFKPEIATVHLLLGLIYSRRGELPKADAAYLRAIELDPTLAAAYVRRGYLLEDQGRLADAAEQYRAALRVDAASKEAQEALDNVWRPR